MISERDAWYSSWFGRDYLLLYPHRDAREAEAQVQFAVPRLALLPGSRLLDVACGEGRHLRHFWRAGIEAFGLDLSAHLLRRAAEAGDCTESSKCLIRGDMRHLPFSDNCFDAISCFFTSFGYFETDGEHQALLREWHRVLKKGSRLLLDCLNPGHLRANLEPFTSTQNGDTILEQRRWISPDGRRVEKEITLHKADSGSSERFRESVRLYSLQELEGFFEAAGLLVLDRLGDFSGEAYQEAASKRLILIGRSQ